MDYEVYVIILALNCVAFCLFIFAFIVAIVGLALIQDSLFLTKKQLIELFCLTQDQFANLRINGFLT